MNFRRRYELKEMWKKVFIGKVIPVQAVEALRVVGG
jgi:hypothetical protein